MEEKYDYELLPVIALRGLVAFPGVVMHFEVGREKSVGALDKAMRANQRLLLLPQLSVQDNDPGFDKLNHIGTVVKIKQILRTKGDTIKVLAECLSRAKIVTVMQTDPILSARVRLMPDAKIQQTERIEAIIRVAYHQFEEFADLYR